jgi:hypothetical protein
MLGYMRRGSCATAPTFHLTNLVVVTLMLACVKICNILNSSSFQWHHIHTKFRENPSSGSVSVGI